MPPDGPFKAIALLYGGRGWLDPRLRCTPMRLFPSTQWKLSFGRRRSAKRLLGFPASGTGKPTDRQCSVALFDQDDVHNEVGSSCQRPRLVRVLETVAASTGPPFFGAGVYFL